MKDAARARRDGVILLSCAAVILGSQALADPVVSVVPLPFEVQEFRGPASRVAETVGSTDALRGNRSAVAGPAVIVWGRAGGAVVTAAGDGVKTLTFTKGVGDLGALERGRGTVPGARIESRGPLTVTLDGPTRDYPHEALGTKVHASAVVITERKPAPPSGEARRVESETSRIEAGPGAVFEDREPRLVDLDGDGSPEILVLRSLKDKGTQLVVIGRREGAWRIVAETPPDGEPFRWMNVAAAGDLGPAFPHAVAVVRRPHLDGVLQVWRFADGRLTLATEKAGYADHAFGSSAQDLAAILPGARGRLVLPTLDRRALAILDLASGGIVETGRIPLPARVQTGVAALDGGAGPVVVAGLEDGRLVEVRP